MRCWSMIRGHFGTAHIYGEVEHTDADFDRRRYGSRGTDTSGAFRRLEPCATPASGLMSTGIGTLRDEYREYLITCGVRGKYACRDRKVRTWF
jgi:hypothetical protein